MKSIQTNSKSYDLDVAQLVLPAIKATSGGTLILTTAKESIKKWFTFLEANIKDRKIYKQTPSSNKDELISEFKTNGHAILVGTKSFWEGINIPGSALSLLIINKLPFPQRNCDLYAEEEKFKCDYPNKRAFNEIEIPRAIIDLKQGFGRLIRSEKDKGIAIICAAGLLPIDLGGKRYSKKFIDALPYMKTTYNIKKVCKSLENLKNQQNKDNEN